LVIQAATGAAGRSWEDAVVVAHMGDETQNEALAAYLAQVLSGLRDLDTSTDLSGPATFGSLEVTLKDLSYTTEPEERRRFEAHRRNIDVQLLLSGRERIYWAPTSALAPETAYDPAQDVAFYSGESAGHIDLEPGLAAVFFPADAHKPNCRLSEGPPEVRKLVVKIPLHR
jgi:YhcH/YjgK/YiaL family protein